jgi:hypothetical protein
VGVLAQNDDFGQQVSSLVNQELSQAGVCIEFNSKSLLRNPREDRSYCSEDAELHRHSRSGISE